MDSIRQNKIARLLQKEIGDIFQKEGKNYTSGKMITVTVIRISPDLSYAKIYISVFPSAKSEELIASLNHNARSIRHFLAQRIRFQMRKVPEIVFFQDDSHDYAQRIDDLLE